jgi:hypothetical protein
MLLNNETILWYFVSKRDVLCTNLHINDFPVFALLATMISFLHDYGTLYSWAKYMLHTPLYLLKIRNHLYQHHSKAVGYYKYSNSFAGAKCSTKSIKCKKMSEEQTFLLPPVTLYPFLEFTRLFQSSFPSQNVLKTEGRYSGIMHLHYLNNK